MALTEIPIELSSTPSIVDGGNATAITIDSSENVGIGATSPGAKLEVADSDGGISVFINNTQSWSAANLSEFNNTALVINTRANGAQLRFSGSTGDVRIQSLTSDLSTAEDISLNPFGGNVGIGTTTPHGKLQFASDINTRKIVLYEGADNNYQFYGFGVESQTLVYSTYEPTDDHVFFSGASSTSRNELMRIEGTGNVGIGVSNPSDYYAKDLVVTGPSEGGITIASTGNHTNYLLFADSTSGVARYAGMVEYAHTI